MNSGKGQGTCLRLFLPVNIETCSFQVAADAKNLRGAPTLSPIRIRSISWMVLKIPCKLFQSNSTIYSDIWLQTPLRKDGLYLSFVFQSLLESPLLAGCIWGLSKQREPGKCSSSFSSAIQRGSWKKVAVGWFDNTQAYWCIPFFPSKVKSNLCYVDIMLFL